MFNYEVYHYHVLIIAYFSQGGLPLHPEQPHHKHRWNWSWLHCCCCQNIYVLKGVVLKIVWTDIYIDKKKTKKHKVRNRHWILFKFYCYISMNIHICIYLDRLVRPYFSYWLILQLPLNLLITAPVSSTDLSFTPISPLWLSVTSSSYPTSTPYR